MYFRRGGKKSGSLRTPLHRLTTVGRTHILYNNIIISRGYVPVYNNNNYYISVRVCACHHGAPPRRDRRDIIHI